MSPCIACGACVNWMKDCTRMTSCSRDLINKSLFIVLLSCKLASAACYIIWVMSHDTYFTCSWNKYLKKGWGMSPCGFYKCVSVCHWWMYFTNVAISLNQDYYCLTAILIIVHLCLRLYVLSTKFYLDTLCAVIRLAQFMHIVIFSFPSWYHIVRYCKQLLSNNSKLIQISNRWLITSSRVTPLAPATKNILMHRFICTVDCSSVS